MHRLFALPLLSLSLLGLLGTIACGGGSSQTATADGGDPPATADGGGTATADASVCDAQTQIAVNDYAHVTGLGTDSCQPLPAACAPQPTCACVVAAFRCGITTTCEERTLPLHVVCQPD